MISIILYLVSIKSLVIALLNDDKFNISGICGYPGEPLSAQHNVENQRVFHSGHTVSYQCVDSLGYKQERSCFNGQWVGPPARCGYGKDNDLKRVIVKDCLKGQIIADFDQIRLQKNFDRFVNSFSTERFDEQPIRVLNSTCLRWHLHLTKRSHFQFVRTDFATVFDVVSKSNREVPIVTAFVGKKVNSNLCEIEAIKQYKHIFTNKWINYGYKYHFYFTCHINNSTESRNVLIVETVTKVPLTLDLVRFSVTEVFGGASDPACGIPEIPVGVAVKPIKEYQLYELFCDEPFFRNTNGVIKTELKCTSNAIWSGSYPECKPRMSCAVAHPFNSNSNAPIKSIENVFYYNKTVWFAINGTVINYYCRQLGSGPMSKCLGDSLKYSFLNNSIEIKSKKCLTNGFWDKEESVCNQFDEDFNESTGKRAEASRELIKESIRVEHLMPVYGMVAFTSLVVIIIAITALVLIWKKNKRKEYNDPNEGSPAQNESKPCKERQCEVIGWNDRPVTTNTYIDENRTIYRKQYQYHSEAIYDVPPNNSTAIYVNNKELELDQNIISEPIYDQPKHRHPNSDQ